jgi:outer membrane cobalamin receptor
MPLFVTDTTLELQNKFNVIYDNMNILKVKASLGYVKIKDLSARLYAAYYHYIPKNEEKAWHMPNFEIGMDAAYTLQEKYTLKASILALGSKYAKTYLAGQVEPAEIGGAFDLGAGFEYQVNRMVSAYVDVDNILNQHYQRYFEYPVQGILVMAGAKISF